MTSREREQLDFMEQQKVNILRVQETKWKGAKAKGIGSRYNFLYNGEDSRRNGVGIILDEKLKMLKVERRWDYVDKAGYGLKYL